MSYPNVIYGDYGDQHVAQSTKIGGLPLGQLMILPDGGKFRHARAHTALALTAGYLYEASGTAGPLAGTGYEKALTCTAAVGATSVVVTCPTGTALIAKTLDDGYLHVASSSGTGVGYTYKIKTNNSAAAGATATISLYPSNPIVVAIGGSTPLVGVKENEYNALDVTTADTAQKGPLAGIACMATSAGFYTWVQRSGVNVCKIGATAMVRGDNVHSSTAVIGHVQNAITAGTTGAKSRGLVGCTMTVSETGGWSQVRLAIE